MRDPYSVLGVSSSATDEEIKAAYHELARKYHPDNYAADHPLRDIAEEKMQEINKAYDEIVKLRSKSGSKSSGQQGSDYKSGKEYAGIRRLINDRRFSEAERALFEISDADKTAEWHYLMSVVLMSRNRINDAMRELEIACNMDPSNYEYQKAKEMFNNTARGYQGPRHYGSETNGPMGGGPAGGGPYRQRGGGTSTSDACDCCANLICLDCLCECMGGDLIRCI